MAVHDDRFPSRKHPRLKAFDYSKPNYYFVTICTQDKICLFGSSEKRNLFGKIAEEGILQIHSHFPNARVDKFVVMRNHVHMILVLDGDGASLPTVIGQYKAYVTKKIREKEANRQVWQTSFHDHIIRNQQAYEKIWLYIEANPLNWHKDCFYPAEQENKPGRRGHDPALQQR